MAAALDNARREFHSHNVAALINRCQAKLGPRALGLRIIAGLRTQGSAEARFTRLGSPWALLPPSLRDSSFLQVLTLLRMATGLELCRYQCWRLDASQAPQSPRAEKNQTPVWQIRAVANASQPRKSSPFTLTLRHSGSPVGGYH